MFSTGTMTTARSCAWVEHMISMRAGSGAPQPPGIESADGNCGRVTLSRRRFSPPAALARSWPEERSCGSDLPLRRPMQRACWLRRRPATALTVFVDARALRRTGILQRIAGEAGRGRGLPRFVEAAGFEYRRGLDACRAAAARRRAALDRPGGAARRRPAAAIFAPARAMLQRAVLDAGVAAGATDPWVRLGRRRWGIAVSPDPLAAAAFTDGTRRQQPPEWQPPKAPAGFTCPAACQAPEGRPRGRRWRWAACARVEVDPVERRGQGGTHPADARHRLPRGR